MFSTAEIFCCLLSALYKPVLQQGKLPKHSCICREVPHASTACNVWRCCKVFSCNICKVWLTNKESEEYSTGSAILPPDKLALSYLPWQCVCAGHPCPEQLQESRRCGKAGKQHDSSWSDREQVKMKGRERKPDIKAALSFPFGHDTNPH